MKLFKCQHCAQLLYFENTLCVKCGHRLGYIPSREIQSALQPKGYSWRALADKHKLYRFCSNAQYGVCNWLVEADSADVFCIACRHNHIIPDTSVERNLIAWRKIEAAKHRLFYALIKLKLPLNYGSIDDRDRLVFDFLATPADAALPTVMTGHNHGLITVAIEEADDAERERRRTAMHEPYRTLLGHFRHEIAHYFWDTLVRDGDQLEGFRTIFGDERQEYSQALQLYYCNGATPDWQDSFVSAYASCHPWEDFAETWAHYLHIVDTLETSRAFGLYINPPIAQSRELKAAVDFEPYRAPDAVTLVEAWIPLSNALNELNRSMGQSDLYPFVLSPAVINKLGAIHDLVHVGWPDAGDSRAQTEGHDERTPCAAECGGCEMNVHQATC
jgi:hypothetical protein